MQVLIVRGISLSPTESSQNANTSTVKCSLPTNSSSSTTATSQCRARLWTSLEIGHRIECQKDTKVRAAAKSIQNVLWMASWLTRMVTPPSRTSLSAREGMPRRRTLTSKYRKSEDDGKMFSCERCAVCCGWSSPRITFLSDTSCICRRKRGKSENHKQKVPTRSSATESTHSLSRIPKRRDDILTLSLTK